MLQPGWGSHRTLLCSSLIWDSPGAWILQKGPRSSSTAQVIPGEVEIPAVPVQGGGAAQDGLRGFHTNSVWGRSYKGAAVLHWALLPSPQQFYPGEVWAEPELGSVMLNPPSSLPSAQLPPAIPAPPFLSIPASPFSWDGWMDAPGTAAALAASSPQKYELRSWAVPTSGAEFSHPWFMPSNPVTATLVPGDVNLWVSAHLEEFLHSEYMDF